MPRMSCSLTVPQVRNRTKTVTRRTVWTWTKLKPGDRLTLIEKGMGLKKGQRQVVLAHVEVVANDVIELCAMDHDECCREGFPEMSVEEFQEFWLKSHNLFFGSLMDLRPDGKPPYPVSQAVVCRRIEWRYI